MGNTLSALHVDYHMRVKGRALNKTKKTECDAYIYEAHTDGAKKTSKPTQISEADQQDKEEDKADRVLTRALG